MRRITIELSATDVHVISAGLAEYGGGSASDIATLSGHDDRAVQPIYKKIERLRVSDANELSLTEAEWRVIYDSVNAALYALGPFALELCTGCSLVDLLQTNLHITTSVWGMYGGAKWADYYEVSRKQSATQNDSV